MREGSEPRPKRVALVNSSLHEEPCGGLRVVVIGMGYVGLVTAACLATLGHEVTAVDVDLPRIRCLERGELPFHEAGLAPLVQAQVASGRLIFTASGSDAIARAELVFIAVGTPARSDGATDMRAVDAVLRELCEVARGPTVIVMKSTVPVGTARGIAARLAETCAPCAAPRVLSNPEFLREGCAVDDFMHPERIVIGDDTPADGQALRLMKRLYAPLIEAGAPVLAMDTRSAELSKYAANAMLAMRISFVNELAGIATATGADIEQVSAGIGSDPRIGTHFLRPGLGFGGSCFPKDVAALRETARRHGLRSDMLLATEHVNRRQGGWALDALMRDFGSHQSLRGLRVALWGLAFKPGTDDIRDAPGLMLLRRLTRAGVIVSAYDPVAMPNARAAIAAFAASAASPQLNWADSAAQALQGADVLLLATEWPEFVAFEPRLAAAALAFKTVYDGRNALDPAAWAAAGVRLVQVGRVAPMRMRSRATNMLSSASPVLAPRAAWSIVTDSVP